MLAERQIGFDPMEVTESWAECDRITTHLETSPPSLLPHDVIQISAWAVNGGGPFSFAVSIRFVISCAHHQGSAKVFRSCKRRLNRRKPYVFLTLATAPTRIARELVVQELGIALLAKRGVRLLTASGDDLTDSDDLGRKMMRQVAGAFVE